MGARCPGGAELWPELHGIAIAILVQMIDWVPHVSVRQVGGLGPELRERICDGVHGGRPRG